MNNAVLIGNLGKDPELRYTPNGAATVKFSLAVQNRYKKGDEWVEGETLWINVSCWRQLAENIAESLSKGDRVVVAGKLKTNSWEDAEGNKRSTTELDAEVVAPSLQYASAVVTKNPRSE